MYGALHCCTILYSFFYFFGQIFIKVSGIKFDAQPSSGTDGRQGKHIEANRTLPQPMRTRFHGRLSSLAFYMQYNIILFFTLGSPTVTLIVSQCRDMFMI
jgi:hypothetical protein